MMTDEKMQPKAGDTAAPTKPEQDQEVQQSQANVGIQIDHRATPGRKPLFRAEGTRRRI